VETIHTQILTIVYSQEESILNTESLLKSQPWQNFLVMIRIAARSDRAPHRNHVFSRKTINSRNCLHNVFSVKTFGLALINKCFASVQYLD